MKIDLEKIATVSAFGKLIGCRYCHSRDGRWSENGKILPWFHISTRNGDGVIARFIYFPYIMFVYGKVLSTKSVIRETII